MSSDFSVFSANWQSEVKASSYYDAALQATKLNLDTLGKDFNIAPIVVAVKKDSDLRSFDSVMVLEDLGHYDLARQIRIFIKNRNEQNPSRD